MGRSGRTFTGFPEGKADPTPIPSAFFTDLLPEIDHLGELKLTLYAFWALARKAPGFRYLTLSALERDQLLVDSLALNSPAPETALQDALERCVGRGSLLRVHSTGDPQAEPLFFLNSPKGRAAAEGYARGDWTPSGEEAAPVELGLDRPNVFTLYEQNLGPLTPMIAERLREAEQSFPAGWIEDAIRIAVENNVRKWSYVQAILDDWQRRGKDAREDRGDTEKARRRYLEGELADSSNSG
ncbi:MAG TPA: DnaD domain protein [Anaerolineales bacterium]|nr:DnaD domain protein [Anaerolineales bacterium]